MAEDVMVSGNPDAKITTKDVSLEGIIAPDKELSLVVQSANSAKSFLEKKQWTLLWRDADLLYQAPRPLTVYENTYVLEPNVQRFTVAKICNAVVPQLYKGLFYDDPPMLMRPRPGTSQVVVDAKMALFSFLLEQCGFKTQTKWGLEQMVHLGTGIYKWGYDYKEICTYRRKATTLNVDFGTTAEGVPNTDKFPTDSLPKIDTETQTMPMPFFEWRPLDKVYVDPQLDVSDIRKAGWVIDCRYMDWYQLSSLKKSVLQMKEQEGDDYDETAINELAGWKWPSDKALKKLWATPVVSPPTDVEQTVYTDGVVHHAEQVNVSVSPDPFCKKLEILEYWDKKRKIVVLNNRYVLFSGDNEFRQIPFLSSNWWNRPKAFYGMGLGLIIGQNQRVDQGTVNAILKLLSFGINPTYLRNRDDNAPTQMIRTGLGKIISVTDTEKSYKLMESPKVPPDIWAALKENQDASESASGADQMLVQGSSAGPRSSMGRTSGGANILAGASATRLDGPLDNFIEQVFKPFLNVLDMMVFNVMSDAAIIHVLGKQTGKELLSDSSFSMQAFHDAQIEYEVLAGSSLSAKRTMAQSMVMLTQILDNPQIQESLAEINEEYIDFKPIINMWLEASEWRNNNDIIKPMTPEMKAKRQANSKAAQVAAQAQAKQQQDQEKFDQKQKLEDQASDNRMKRDITREAMKTTGLSEAVSGEPNPNGLQGDMPQVV